MTRGASGLWPLLCAFVSGGGDSRTFRSLMALPAALAPSSGRKRSLSTIYLPRELPGPDRHLRPRHTERVQLPAQPVAHIVAALSRTSALDELPVEGGREPQRILHGVRQEVRIVAVVRLTRRPWLCRRSHRRSYQHWPWRWLQAGQERCRQRGECHFPRGVPWHPPIAPVTGMQRRGQDENATIRLDLYALG